MPITIPLNELPGPLSNDLRNLLVPRNFLRYSCAGYARMSLDEIFLDLMMMEGFLFHANRQYAVIIKNLQKYVDGDIMVVDIAIFRKRNETNQTIFDLIMNPQIRNSLLPVVKSTITIREFKGTKSMDGLKIFVDICYICNCLLIGAADVFISHFRLCHHKLSDETVIRANFRPDLNSHFRGLDHCLYNATTSDTPNDPDLPKFSVFATWHSTSVKNDHTRVKHIYHHPANGKTEHGCLFCGIQYENMRASDVELLRNDWNDDTRHYVTANKFIDNNRIFPYSSFRPIVVGHMMKHLAKTIEECKAGTSPFTSVWKYANQMYDNNAGHRERDKLNANKQKKQ